MKMEPIDVRLVTEYYHPVLSGATERFRRYAPGLRERGVNLRVMTVHREGMVQQEVIDGVPVQRFSINNDFRSPSAALLSKTLRHTRQTGDWPQVLQLISHTLEGAPDVWRFRLHGIPCLNTITMIPTIPSNPISRVKSFIHQSLRYSPFNMLVTSSTVVSQRMTCQGVSSRRLSSIPNGVDLDRFHPAVSLYEKRSTRLKLNIDPEDELILFVGFISYRKGVDLLIEAWSQVITLRPRARLFLVGPLDDQPQTNSDCTGTFYRDILARIDSLPSPERIHFTGAVDNVEVYMRASDLLVFPSRLEGMGNVVAEAMASGLPCVLTPYEGLPREFGEPDSEYILALLDSYSIANKIIDMLEDKDKKHQMQIAARKWAVSYLDIEKSLDRYTQMYQMLSQGKI